VSLTFGELRKAVDAAVAEGLPDSVPVALIDCDHVLCAVSEAETGTVCRRHNGTRLYPDPGTEHRSAETEPVIAFVLR
jgi:hypothetical protein